MRGSCLTVGLFLSAYFLNAQPHRFQRYTIHEGLSQSSVKCIVEDQTGFMWFGTQDGLNRFDGKNFKTWKRGKRLSLSDNNISQIIEVHDKKLWIGTQGGGVNVYDTGRDSVIHITHIRGKIKSLLDNNVSSLIRTSSGEIWVGSDKGITVLDPSHYNVKAHVVDFDVSPVTVNYMAEDKLNHIWVATRHGGVYVFDLTTKKQISHITRQELGLALNRVDPVRHLFSDKLGRIWVSTNRGLFMGDPALNLQQLKKMQLITPAGNFTNNVIMCTMLDHMQRLWIGTQSGLLIEKDGLFEHYTSNINSPYSLSDRVILSLYQDKNHIVWIGTYNGVNKFVYNAPKFQTYKFDIHDRSKNLNVVRSLFTEDDDQIFVGTVNSLCLLDRKTESVDFIKDMQNNNLQNVFCISKDSKGDLWTGNSNGLQKIQRKGMRYVVSDAIHHPELNIFAGSEVTQLVHTVHERYLIATYNENGLFMWDRNKHAVTNFRSKSNDPATLADNKVNYIHVASGGKVWIATNKGISYFDTAGLRFVNYYPAGIEPVNPGQQIVNAISDDGEILWLATNGGLIRYDPRNNESKAFSEEDGLANNTLYSCLPANDSVILMSSNHGISEFNKTTNRFTNYDASDGLQSNEYNRYAWYRSAKGMMYFGGMEGLDVFTSATDELRPRPLVITGLRVIDNNKFAELNPADKALNLHHSENAIGFDYALLDFDQPHRNTYLCKLEGFDDSWIDNGDHTTISYTNLQPGEYTFMVTLKGDQMNTAKYSFTILTPYWQTSWFIGLVSLGVFGIVAFLIRQYYNRKIERQRLVFEKQQAVEFERTRIATDMHDDLGAGLSRIKFLSETIGIKLQNKQTADDDVVKIKAYSTEMIDKMGEIVWALNKGNDSLSDLLSYTRAYTAEYLTQNNILSEIFVNDEVAPLFVSGEFRRNVFLTVKEALHNIVKHSGADKVEITFSVSEKLMITIVDNGKGFDSGHVRPFRNGISNMHKRLNDIGGTIEIENAKGTVVRLVAPLRH
jgi:ligand-binding sensor domain-containing protein/signal transduction histidine kinase